MILPASYSNGFAPRDGQPLYPELWRGCVGAWAPCLGPTGVTLRDWSGFGNHGTLTNMDAAGDWVPSQGRYTLDFDGTDDVVAVGNAPSLQFNFTDRFSFSAWIKTTATTGGIIGKRSTTGWYFTIDGANIISLVLQGTGVTAIIVNSVASGVSDGNWHHVAATYRGNSSASGISMFVDGRQVSTTTVLNTVAGTCINTDAVAIGGVSTTTFRFTGQIDDCRAYSGVLQSSQIRLLSLRRGIAYELAPRRRSRVAVQFNRRRRLLLGAS